ncbi:hypothetical protein [Feifania hominis]|uniref:Uncharacterized protein n=1 Tax=Feifania hominis TaxID=2763660 RepID=A0A926DFV1_9FIRM|nr:hypothetical protein [Feifania hominis]MBC8537052.1 hypothetical protein [Feifania hominis]
MTTVEWLSRARSLDSEITALLTAQRRAFERVLNVTGRLREIVVKGGLRQDPMERYLELEETINERINELLEVKQEILAAIRNIDRQEYRVLLIDRYVNGYTWEKVAQHMHYSTKHVLSEMHPAALDAAQRVLEEESRRAG